MANLYPEHQIRFFCVRDLPGQWPRRMFVNPSESMKPESLYPAPHGAGFVLPIIFQPKPDAFERLPINLSREEIREMVLEILG